MSNNNVNLFLNTLQEISGIVELSKCLLCSKPSQNPVSISCEHTFCNKCLNKNIKKGINECPKCNNPFSPEEIQTNSETKALTAFSESITKSLKATFKQDVLTNFNKLIKKKDPSVLLKENVNSTPRKGTNKPVTRSNGKRKRTESMELSQSNKNVFDLLCASQRSATYQVKKPKKTYSNTRRSAKTPKTKLEEEIAEVISEFNGSNKRNEIVKWLYDTKNSFDKKPQSQEEVQLESQSASEYENLESVSQANKLLYDLKVKIAKNERKQIKEISQSYRKARSLNVLEVKRKKNLKRRTIATETPDFEEVVIEGDDNNCNSTEVLQLMEEALLNNFEEEFVKPEIPKVCASREVGKEKTDSGWKRLKRMNKSISKSSMCEKQLKVKKKTVRKKSKEMDEKSRLETTDNDVSSSDLNNVNSSSSPNKVLDNNQAPHLHKEMQDLTGDHLSVERPPVSLTDIENFIQSHINEVEITPKDSQEEDITDKKDKVIIKSNILIDIKNPMVQSKENLNQDSQNSVNSAKEEKKIGTLINENEHLSSPKDKGKVQPVNEEKNDVLLTNKESHDLVNCQANNQIFKQNNVSTESDDVIFQVATQRFSPNQGKKEKSFDLNKSSDEKLKGTPAQIEKDDDIFVMATQQSRSTNQPVSEIDLRIDTLDNYIHNLINTFGDIITTIDLLKKIAPQLSNIETLYKIKQIEEMNLLIEKLKDPHIELSKPSVNETKIKENRAKVNRTINIIEEEEDLFFDNSQEKNLKILEKEKQITNEAVECNNSFKVPEAITDEKKIGNKRSIYELSASFDELEFETQDAVKECLNRSKQNTAECTVTQILDKLGQENSEPQVLSSWKKRTPSKRFKPNNSRFTTSNNISSIATNQIELDNTTSVNKKSLNNSHFNQQNPEIDNSIPDKNLDDIMNKIESNETKINNKNLNNPVIKIMEDNTLENEKFLKEHVLTTSFNADRFIKNTTNFESDVQSLVNTVMSAASKGNTSITSNQASGMNKTTQGSDIVITLSQNKNPPVHRKLEFPEENRFKIPQITFSGTNQNDAQIKKPVKSRMVDVSVCFETQTPDENLNEVSMGSSDFNMDYVDQVWNKIDKGLIGNESPNKKCTQEVIENCDRLLKDVTTKYSANVKSPEDEEIPAYQRIRSNQSKDNVVVKSGKSELLQNLIDDDVLDFMDKPFSEEQKLSESIFVELPNSQPQQKSTLDNYINEFNLDDENDREMGLIATNDIIQPGSSKVLIALQGQTNVIDTNKALSEDEYYSDCDIIEGTPENTPKKPIIPGKNSAESETEEFLDCLPPPPEFQDPVDESNQDITIKPNNQPEEPLNASIASKENSQYAESLSLSPISKLVSQNTLTIGTPNLSFRNKRCSTPRTQKQVSIKTFMVKQATNKQIGGSLFKPNDEDKKPCIACTRLSREQIVAISALANKKLATYSADFNQSVTHMVVNVDENNSVKDHTIKFVSAVAAGIWVVSFKWVQKCLSENKIVPEAPYEVFDLSGNSGPKESRLYRKVKPLLENFKVFAAPPFVSTTQSHVENILKMLGATVVSTPEELANRGNSVGLIITEGASQDVVQYEDWMYKLKVVTVDIEWLSSSVSQFKLQSFWKYALCSNDNFSLLSYPNELVEAVPFTFTNTLN